MPTKMFGIVVLRLQAHARDEHECAVKLIETAIELLKTQPHEVRYSVDWCQFDILSFVPEDCSLVCLHII